VCVCVWVGGEVDRLVCFVGNAASNEGRVEGPESSEE